MQDRPVEFEWERTARQAAERAVAAQRAINDLGAGVPAPGPPWTEANVQTALRNYDALVIRAHEVAIAVYHVRYPREAAPGFEITFDTELKPMRVYASYYYRSNNHSLDFPVDYLWEDNVTDREAERMEAERQHAQRQKELREAAEEAEREQIERKTYERLKAKYEPGSADGRPKRLRSERSSNAT